MRWLGDWTVFLVCLFGVMSVDKQFTPRLLCSTVLVSWSLHWQLYIMRASGGVYLTPAPRLSSTVRSVAIILASMNTQTMALCCVSWILFFFCQMSKLLCSIRVHPAETWPSFAWVQSLLQGRLSIKLRSWGVTKSEYNGETMNCKKIQTLIEVNHKYSQPILCNLVIILGCFVYSMRHNQDSKLESL